MSNLEDCVSIFNVKKLEKEKERKRDNLQTPTIISYIKVIAVIKQNEEKLSRTLTQE